MIDWSASSPCPQVNERLETSQTEVYRLRREKDELERRLNEAGGSSAEAGEMATQLASLRSRVDFTDRLLVQQRQVNEKQTSEVSGMRQQMAAMRDSLERSETQRQQLSQELDSLRGEYDQTLVAGAGQGDVFSASNWRAMVDDDDDGGGSSRSGSSSRGNGKSKPAFAFSNWRNL